MRLMYDASDPANLPVQTRSTGLIAGYKTGTPGSNWIAYPADVWIDQAGSGAPVYSCNVMDVEPGAYRPHQIEEWTNRCTAPVPTVYCDRTDYPDCRSVWSGAIWLAFPGAVKANVDAFTRSVIGKTDENIVACQNVFNGTYDQSDIYDALWPFKIAMRGNEMLTGQLFTNGEQFIPFPPGRFRELIVYRDFINVDYRIRVAVHSVTKGYTVIQHVIKGTIPESITFTEQDVDGVSLVNESPCQVGWTLA